MQWGGAGSQVGEEPSEPKEQALNRSRWSIDSQIKLTFLTGPSHRDPDAFHIEKSEIERALRRLARRPMAR